MQRLPGYDRQTSRAETLAFWLLALAALPLLMSGVWEAGRYSLEREAIISNLDRPAAAMIATTRTGTNVSMKALSDQTAQPSTFRTPEEPRS